MSAVDIGIKYIGFLIRSILYREHVYINNKSINDTCLNQSNIVILTTRCGIAHGYISLC